MNGEHHLVDTNTCWILLANQFKKKITNSYTIWIEMKWKTWTNYSVGGLSDVWLKPTTDFTVTNLFATCVKLALYTLNVARWLCGFNPQFGTLGRIYANRWHWDIEGWGVTNRCRSFCTEIAKTLLDLLHMTSIHSNRPSQLVCPSFFPFWVCHTPNKNK